jgi:hypothetical protein
LLHLRPEAGAVVPARTRAANSAGGASARASERTDCRAEGGAAAGAGESVAAARGVCCDALSGVTSACRATSRSTIDHGRTSSAAGRATTGDAFANDGVERTTTGHDQARRAPAGHHARHTIACRDGSC